MASLLEKFHSIFHRPYTIKSPRDFGPLKFKCYTPQLYDIDISPYIREFTKEDFRSTVAPGDYRIYIHGGQGNSPFNGIYCDAEYNFVLTRGPVPKKKSITQASVHGAMACISFNLEMGPGIFIKQLQGVEGAGTLLKAFRWEKMLLKVVTDWAKAHDYTKVRLQRAEDNSWKNIVGIEKLKIRYDVTAKRSGFKYDEESRTYVLVLQ